MSELKQDTPAEDDMATKVFWEILSPLGYIPQPVKEALRSTGFDNLLSLSAMQDSDLKDIAAQFKLAMGHQRLIRVLSERVNQLGLDDLTAKLLRKLDRQASTIVKVPKPTPPNPTSSDSRDETSPSRPVPSAEALVEIYRSKLQQNILSWLTTHGEVGIKEIELQDININVSILEGKLQGSVICPFCRMEIKIYIRAPDADSSGAIANSNYIKHYNRMHRKIPLPPKSPATGSWPASFSHGTPPLSTMLNLEQHQQALAQLHAEQEAFVAASGASSAGRGGGTPGSGGGGASGNTQLPNPATIYELLFKQESASWSD
ncbi:uncharacterized protein LOC129770068 [Toxorhynchites rutilus septentrionalis]|uniref:uncharacterized protein LOC129770068 n=1 Tax=Toxorhynchites rutilus septentrionalis TaxID=329112 RepID=UPI002478EEED|nr:uncharacterized protein LOC129770068 [Toxorhynchites rutilus septentrionalis]